MPQLDTPTREDGARLYSELQPDPSLVNDDVTGEGDFGESDEDPCDDFDDDAGDGDGE